MKKPSSKPKQRGKSKLKKEGTRTPALAGNKSANVKKSRGARQTRKTALAKSNLRKSPALKKFKTQNQQLSKQLEQQTRQLEIEASLERVRSRTMAMQKSDELTGVISILNSEVKKLGVMFDTCSIVTNYNHNSDPG